MNPGWYVRRLKGMGPAEIAARVQHQFYKSTWRRRQMTTAVDARISVHPAGFRSGLGSFDVPSTARAALLAAADALMDGRWTQFGSTRTDVIEPDWFRDPVSGLRSDPLQYAFAVPYRDASQVGNVKQVWELSRHHHLTVLAAAYRLTGDRHYAERCAAHLRSWWAANPFLSGIHWTSGIEVGIRVISWAWVRRLLDGWDGVEDLFDRSALFRQQLEWHEFYLEHFFSRGSSANNHVVAEAAGQLVSALAFPWTAKSDHRCEVAGALLLDELEAQTFGSGLNRELASEYHGLVLELAWVAAAEHQARSGWVPARLRDVIIRMTDALAALVDDRLHAPRQGDGDDGYGLMVDDPHRNRWCSLLATGDTVFGALAWWPEGRDHDVMSAALAAAVGNWNPGPRPRTRPGDLRDAGVALLRNERLWVRCDGGPHGFLSIAAHAHADALSIELRVDGVEVLVDPGTYCYHDEPAMRRLFRSTRGHNTIEIGGVDQSESGGPFLWTRHATTRVLEVTGLGGPVAKWVAEHDGYERLRVTHRRTVTVLGEACAIVDDLVARKVAQPLTMAFHLGPTVNVQLTGSVAALSWPGGRAIMELDDRLVWSIVCGSLDPPLGWYSPGFGRKQPISTLVGAGTVHVGAVDLHTRFALSPIFKDEGGLGDAV